MDAAAAPVPSQRDLKAFARPQVEVDARGCPPTPNSLRAAGTSAAIGGAHDWIRERVVSVAVLRRVA